VMGVRAVYIDLPERSRFCVPRIVSFTGPTERLFKNVNFNRLLSPIRLRWVTSDADRPHTGIRHRRFLNGSRKNGFVVTVSTRALKVARRNSLSGLFHQYGISPQRICTGSRLPSEPFAQRVIVIHDQDVRHGTSISNSAPSLVPL
jgi:hypothetical protein